MDDQQTTTDAPVDTGVETTQPVQTDQPAADEGTTSDQTPSNDAPSFDEDTTKWLESKGIDPSSPEALAKVAKSAREAEKAMHAKAGEASHLKKSMDTVADSYAEEEATATGQDPELVKTVKRLLVRDSIREFWDAHPDAKEHESAIAQIVQERPYLANDLEAAYALIQSKNAKSEGAKQALENLASKQRAAAPSGAAVSSAVTTKASITRAELAKRTQAGDIGWLNKNMPTINQMVAEGTLQ